MVYSFRAAVAHARLQGDLYFAALLSQDRIQNAFGKARCFWQGWIYTPAVTVWVFLSQCLSPDHSCRDAVARLIAWRVACGLKPCSADTGAYCTARNDLPEEALHGLMCDSGKWIEDESPQNWLWHGRKVRVVDGSTITMPDTPENQAAYPQMKAQKPGCGFPIARILVIFSLSVGTVLDAAIGKYKGKQAAGSPPFLGFFNIVFWRQSTNKICGARSSTGIFQTGDCTDFCEAKMGLSPSECDHYHLHINPGRGEIFGRGCFFQLFIFYLTGGKI